MLGGVLLAWTIPHPKAPWALAYADSALGQGRPDRAVQMYRAIADRNPRWLRRNALICVGNTATPDDDEARHALEDYRDGDDDLLAEHARWALAQIASR